MLEFSKFFCGKLVRGEREKERDASGYEETRKFRECSLTVNSVTFLLGVHGVRLAGESEESSIIRLYKSVTNCSLDDTGTIKYCT